jgi:hypothetical protein
MGADMLKLCLSMGYQMIVSGGDVAFLANTSKSTATEAREILKGHAPAKKPAAKEAASSPY